MIDVSKLSHIEAEIVLLIERRGAEGRRVCELCAEIQGNTRNIKKHISALLKNQYIFKTLGDTTRYYLAVPVAQGTPMVAQETPMVAQGTPMVAQGTPMVAQGTPEPLKLNSHVNVHERNVTEPTNGEIFVKEEKPATSLPAGTRKTVPARQRVPQAEQPPVSAAPAPFPANSAYSAPQSITDGELPPFVQTALKTACTAPSGTGGIITAAPPPEITQFSKSAQFPKNIAERFLLRQKLEFTAGTIFVSENRPTEYLHRMLAELGIDYVKNGLLQTAGYELFLDGLPKFYRQFHKKTVRYGVDDFILHCLSFLRAKGYPQR